MYIHLGNRQVISDKNIIGIFNIETLKMSKINSFILGKTNSGDKTAAVDKDNNIYSAGVSPYTVIKRKEPVTDFIWRRDNER